MTELEALRILGIKHEEIAGLTMVKLSRQFARIKMTLEEDSPEYEKLFEAFEYMKANYVALKNKKEENFPEDFFPQINTTSEVKRTVGVILNLEVEGTPTEISFAKVGDREVFVHMPLHTETQDTVTFLYDKHIYEGNLVVKNVSRKEYEELLACQDQ